MKEIRGVNIAGMAFTIEVDAAEILDNYISGISQKYKGSDLEGELVADIESRIAELLLTQIHEPSVVVTIAQVNDVIEQLGSVESFEDDTLESSEPQTKEYTHSGALGERRLYRNMDGAKLGGVINGIAAYFKGDVTIYRLIYAILAGVLLFNNDSLGEAWLICTSLYFAMWIFTPVAKTASQKLQMQGRKVTPSSIEDTLRRELDNALPPHKSKRTASLFAGLLYGLGRILRFFVILIISIVSIIILISIIAAISGMSIFFAPMLAIAATVTALPVVAMIAIAIIMLLPPVLLLLFLAKLVFKFKVSRYVGITFFALFCISIAYIVYSLTSNVLPYHQDRATNTVVQTIASDTLYVEPLPSATLEGKSRSMMGDNNIAFKITNIDFNQSVDSLFKIKIERTSSGESYADAEYRASELEFDYKIVGNKLMLDPDIDRTKIEGLANVDCRLTIYVPKGANVVVSDRFKRYNYQKKYNNYISDEIVSSIENVDNAIDKDIARQVVNEVQTAFMKGNHSIVIDDDGIKMSIVDGGEVQGITIDDDGIIIRRRNDTLVVK